MSAEEPRRLHDHIEQVHDRYHKLVARAWDDPEFKKRLVSEPDAVFKEHGIELPQGVRVRVMENTSEAWNFVLPAKVTDVTDEALTPGSLAQDCVCTCCCGYTAALDEQLMSRTR